MAKDLKSENYFYAIDILKNSNLELVFYGDIH